MLENFIWKNVFLPEFLKKEVVAFYEKQSFNYYVKKNQEKKPLTQLIISNLCNRIHKNWFKDNQYKTNKVFFNELEKDIGKLDFPMFFLLLISKTNKIEKLKKLLDWGLNLKSYVTGSEINLLHQIIWVYHKGLISKKDCEILLDTVIKENVSLFEKNYKISHYEKTISLLKNESVKINNLFIKNNKLIELLNVWIDKDLYLYLINSKLSDNDKSILEYVNLKKRVHTIYIEKYSNNTRKDGYNNINKQIYLIEEIIKREYIFINQSSTYNSLSLILNLPEFTDIVNPKVILKCYQNFNRLKNFSKKSLTTELLSKNKEVVLLNLINYGINFNWQIDIDNKKNILGLELFSNANFIEYIIENPNFQINKTNIEGNNILHLLGDIEINNESIKEKIFLKIQNLSHEKKDFLFNQFNEKNLTPILKAVNEKNIMVIQFLLEIGISGIEEIKGIEFSHSSPLNFLENQLNESNSNNEKLTKDDIEKEEFMYAMYKKWNIEKSYQKISNKLPLKKMKTNVSKI